MDLQALMARKREAEQKIAAAREELKATGGKFLIELLSPVFTQYPEVKAVRWQQFTPYFNDGDTCTFGSGHFDAATMAEDKFGELVDTPWRSESSKLAQSLLNGLTDDDMEALFGDHVEVTVYADRVETEKYEHD